MKILHRHRFAALLTALLMLSAAAVQAQSPATEGFVFDNAGNPVAQAAVAAPDGHLLAHSDDSGRFSLEEPYTGAAVISKEGFRSKQIYLRGGDVNNFMLTANLLERPSAVNYGSRKRSELLGSVATVGFETIGSISVANPSQALYGVLAGLIVEEKAEQIGVNTAPNFFVRGKSTFGNASNLPLVLVDGFIRNIDDVNIDDIASVNVLKDAASTALYGMRGANGVIIVETKRGQLGKPQYSINVEQGVQTPLRIPRFVNSARYAQYYNEALNNDGMDAKYSLDRIDAFRNPSIWAPDNQWQDELVRSAASTTKVGASASGGNKIAKYYVSLGYRRENGLFRNPKNSAGGYDTNPSNDRFSAKTNLDITAIRNLDLKLDIGAQINDIALTRTDQASLWDSFYRYPQNEFPMLLPDGTPGGTAAFTENPYAKMSLAGYRKTLNRIIQSSLTGEYHLRGVLEGLSFGGRYAYDNQWIANEYWERTYAVYELSESDGEGGFTTTGRGIDGELGYHHGETDDSQSRRETIEAFIKYTRDFGAGHHIDAAIVYHRNNLKTDNGTPFRNQYVAGTFNYDYRKKYLLEAVLSYSGSEAFASNYRYELYPAAAVGWVVSRENFLKDVRALDFLKIKGSAGLVGNSEMNARFTYRQQTSWYGDDYYFGDTPDSFGGRALSTEANPSLRAEKAFKVDAGAELMLFNSLYVSGGYFFERRYNILTDWSNQFSGVTGLIYPNINSGITHTRGFEIEVNYDKQINDKVSLWGDFTFLWYRNRIVSILETPVPDDSQYQLQTGRHIGASLALVADGIFRTQDEIDNSPAQQFGNVSPGDLRYRDINNDGVINDYDRVYTDAYQIPNTEAGLRLGARFYGFDVSVFLHAQLGTEIYLGDASAVYWPFANNSYRVSQYVNSRTPWTPDTRYTADYPKLSTSNASNNYRRSTFWLVNGDRLRLRSAEIGWTLPDRLAQKAHMSKFRIYLRGNNLLTFDHLKELDPAALASLPMLRSYYLGCNITF